MDLGEFGLIHERAKHIHVYYQLLRPLDQKCAANSRECDTLMKVRDILLPKLISGEIRVKANEMHSGHEYDSNKIRKASSIF
jgi:hypothetical protein